VATSSGSQTTSVARMNSHVRTIAPYSCAVVRISSRARGGASGSPRSAPRSRSARRRGRRPGLQRTRPAPRALPRVVPVEFVSPEPARDLAREEVGRACLELALEALVLLEHRQGTRRSSRDSGGRRSGRAGSRLAPTHAPSRRAARERTTTGRASSPPSPSGTAKRRAPARPLRESPQPPRA
jgi:hypothetical protein